MLRRHPRTSQSIRSFHYRAPRRSSALRTATLILLFGTVTVLSGRELWRWSEFGNRIERTASLLTFTEGSDVHVALEGGEPQRAESALSMYPNDYVRTGNTPALLTFFDGTAVGLGKNTDLHLRESAKGSQYSEVEIQLLKGLLWIRTPKSHAFTGSILRRVLLPSFSFDLPPDTEAIIAENTLHVFAADGIGIRMEQKGTDNVLFIGEGQKWELPQGSSEEVPEDLYVLRSPLGIFPPDPLISISKSLIASLTHTQEKDTEGVQSVPEDLLTILTPLNGLLVSTETIEVTGNAGEGVASVRINGYRTDIAPDHSFHQELTLSDEEETTLRIEALDEKGVPLAETQRIIRRDISPPKAPVIEFPSASGTVYQTQSRELEIRGRAPQDVIGIIVNDYRLQLFKSGDQEWSYLASIELGNFNWGTNVYEIRAIDASGNESEAAVITIVLGEGEEGIVEKETNATKATHSTSSGQAEATKDENDQEKPIDSALLDNDPLMPGSLVIVGPTKGEPFIATGSEFSIYGTVPPQTFSVWINGYRLRLYEPGQRFWKYIASYDLNTLRRGRNVYTVVIRNRRGEVLDRLEYLVFYRVGETR